MDDAAAEPGSWEDLYDEATLELLAQWRPRRSEVGPSRRRPVEDEPVSAWRRQTAAGALVTALALGVQEVLEPRRHDPVVEEVDVDDLADRLQPVTLLFVAGNPRATVAIVRPWLLRTAS